MKKTYIVIGLGRFGSAVAQRLYELGSEVLAIDLRPELVQKMESRVTCAAVCDARDEDALRTLGVRNYDCAIVAIGGDLATSVVATLNLKELGVQRVVCKATDETQRKEGSHCDYFKPWTCRRLQLQCDQADYPGRACKRRSGNLCNW